VRKRVIKIFRDICISRPDFDKIDEICIKMMARISDEETIKVCVCVCVIERLNKVEIFVKKFSKIL